MSGTIIVSARNTSRTLIKLALTLAATVVVIYLLWPVAYPALERVEMGSAWGFANMTELARGLLVAVGGYVVFSGRVSP